MAVNHHQFVENLRYLLWRESPTDRQGWETIAAKWIGTEAATHLLQNDLGWIKDVAVLAHSLAEATGREMEELVFKSLVDQENILQQNIDCLFAGLDHGQRNEFAKSLDVDVSTISRWRRGKLKPSSDRIRALHSRFGLSHDVDLQSTPLFLSPFPVSQSQRRDWLKRQIDQLSLRELNELFPALQRLLGGSRADY